MSVTNKEIVRRVKEARRNRDMTQQDLAKPLGKTASAVSDMERGKVQVSASELSIIADTLNTPIEYFYGEEVGDQYISDIVSLVRKENPEGRANSLESIKMLLSLTQAVDKLNSDPNKEISPEELGQLLTTFVTFTTRFSQMTTQLDDVQKKIIQEINAQGLKIPGINS
jgi:transcriptional regulator with XRE-family HTH domain